MGGFSIVHLLIIAVAGSLIVGITSLIFDGLLKGSLTGATKIFASVFMAFITWLLIGYLILIATDRLIAGRAFGAVFRAAAIASVIVLIVRLVRSGANKPADD